MRRPSTAGQSGPLVGRVRAVGFHPGHRPATQGCRGRVSGVGCGTGTGRQAAQKAAVITDAGCLRQPRMPETAIVVARTRYQAV